MNQSIKSVLLLFLTISSSHSSDDFSQEKIVIIGAGLSGISAASKLLEHGYTNITILEAENRIGGRIWTEFDGDKFLELGSQW